MCKCCQSCLESLYWSCCEERFCYDESIAKYSDDGYDDGKCYSNHTGSIDSLEPITRQPSNNNHLPSNNPRATLAELPILAPDIYKVFSKSMIFNDDVDIKKINEIEETIPTYTRPKSNYNGHIGKVVTFKTDEDTKSGKAKDSPKPEEEPKLSDFEIMFQDELYGDHTMAKIDEEEEEDSVSNKSPTSPGYIVMKSSTETDKVDTPTSLPSLHEQTVDKPPDLLNNKHLTRAESNKSIIRTNSAKCMLKPKGILLPRSDSTKSFTRSNSRQDLLIKRVNSMKCLDNKNIRNVLARLPQKSASFMSIDDLLNDQKENESKSDAVFTISHSDINIHGEHSQISKMPDTPVIKGAKFPKFFAETPVIGEYKAETSLQSIMQTPDVIFVESDFSMPRYYRKSMKIGPQFSDDSQGSKSLPDLHDSDKMSKRLTKLGSKLKPLIIKKHDDAAKHSQQNLQ